jgi:RHS repeat-associated protein
MRSADRLSNRIHKMTRGVDMFLNRTRTNKERLTADGAGYQNTPLGVTSQTGTNANQVIREPNGTAVALRVGGVSYYYIADRHGSIISLASSTGIERNHYSYDPYGASRTKTEAVVNPWQYIGGELDTTGLYHLQNRYYDPLISRFTQPDPSGEEANNYLYAGSNPINRIDPSGLSWKSWATRLGRWVPPLCMYWKSTDQYDINTWRDDTYDFVDCTTGIGWISELNWSDEEAH